MVDFIAHLSSGRRGRFFRAQIIVIVGITLTVLYSTIAFISPRLYESPDETANAFFATSFATKSRLTEPAQTTQTEISALVHPRSIGSYKGNLVQLSFSGFSLIVGLFGRIFGLWILPFVTPILSMLAVFAFYGFLRRIFSRFVARASTVLLAINPAFWYVTSRSMMHNALFLDIILFGLYFFVLGIAKKRWWFGSIGSFLFALAIIIRGSEATWVGVLTVVLLVVLARRSLRKSLFINLLVFLLPLAVFVSFQLRMYGSLITSAAIDPSPADASSSPIVSALHYFFFPFGFDLGRSFAQFLRYCFNPFPFFGLGLLAGVAGLVGSIFAHRRLSRPLVLYTILFVFVALWLIVYYGSWIFTEGADPHEVILGSSYFRYWLPVFVFSLPLTAFVFQVLMRHMRIWNLMVVVFFVALFAQTVAVLYLDSSYGFLAIQKDLKQNAEVLRRARAILPSDSVLITGKNDKIFFPRYAVLVSIPDNPDGKARLVHYAQQHPVFLVVSEDDPTSDQRDQLHTSGEFVAPSSLGKAITVYRFHVFGT